MAGNPYLNVGSNGALTQVAATQTGGSANAGQIVALNSAGQIDSTMLSGISGSPTVTATANVAISAGNLVNLYNNSGVLTAKLADCSTGLPANGFATEAIAADATGSIQLTGLNSSLTGLTVGAPLFLSTAGAVTATAPTTAGYIVQPVGSAVSTTEAIIRPSELPITLV